MHGDLNLQQTQKEWHGTLRSYVVGFFSCVLLTIASFALVIGKVLSGPNLVYTILALALVQAVVQLRFFLHVGQEAKPRWEMVTFFFMVLVLLIIIAGSLWIMHDLNDRVMMNMEM